MNDAQAETSGAFSDLRGHVNAAADMYAIVKQLRRLRRTLLSQLLEFTSLHEHFTKAEMPSIRAKVRELVAAEKLQGDDKPLIVQLEDVATPEKILCQTTLALGVTSDSSDEYWEDEREASTSTRLTKAQKESIAALDYLRNQTVMYAAIVLALILAALGVIVAGRVFSEPLLPLWILVALVLLWLANTTRQVTIWMAIVVGIRERQILADITPVA